MSSEKSPEQLHFEELRKFFVILVSLTSGAITILGAVGAFFFFQNVGEMKENIKDTQVEINDQVKKMGVFAQNSIEGISSTAQKSVKDVEVNAVSLAQKKVDQAFEDKNIQALIQQAAERIAASEVKTMVAKAVEDQKPEVSKKIRNITKASEAYSRATIMGTTDAPKALRQMMKDEDEELRVAAESYIQLLVNAYDSAAKKSPSPLKRENYGDPVYIRAAMQAIENEEIWTSAIGFRDFRLLTGEPIELFDYEHFDTWKKKNPAYLK